MHTRPRPIASGIASSSNGDGYYISAYVTDAAGNGAHWFDAANDRPSGEFIYALEGLGRQQKVALYPPFPYQPAP